MSTDPPPPSRLERLLAYSTLTIVVLALLSFITTLIVGLAGNRELLANGMWPIVVWISYIGLPLAFVLLMTLLIVSMRRRGKENASDARTRQKK